jgi:uncharacterized membrane protein YczE
METQQKIGNVVILVELGDGCHAVRGEDATSGHEIISRPHPSHGSPTMPPSSTTPLPHRVLLMVAGSAIAAYGYLLTVAADLGNGPLFAVQDGIRNQLGMSLAASATVVGLGLVALALALRAPLGAGTVALPIANGLWISALEPFVLAPSGAAVRWIQFVSGTGVMMLGAVLAVSASFGVAALDGVMFGVARRCRVTPARARVGIEVTLASVGVALGGRVGLGTMVMGATVGHLFQFWSRVLARAGLSPLSSRRRSRPRGCQGISRGVRDGGAAGLRQPPH